MSTGINLEQIMKTITRILAVACGIASGLLSFTCCSKSTMPETVKEPVELTANINDVNTKTALDGVKVSWIKNDSIAIQTSNLHKSNSSNPRGYNTCIGIYRLMDDAAVSNVGKFTYVSGDDAVTGDEEFFAFYPASFCSGNASNGYFYFTFPTNQCYEDNIGEKLPLPMYGIGKGKVIDFQYAGSVIRLRVWSEKATEIHSCTISASGLYKKAFTYYMKDEKDGNWSSLQPAHKVNNLVVDMKTPVSISTDANNPTVIPIILPMSGPRTLKNLKFSINCTGGGCELKKKSDLVIDPGCVVNFPVTEIKIDSTRMYVDGLEGEVDLDWIKTAKESVRVTMPKSAILIEKDFKDIMEATRSLNQQVTPDNPFSQISLDLSETTAKNSSIRGLENNQYVGFCGGKNRDSGIKNISEFRLPKGITQIMNRAFAYSDYTKIVLPSTVNAISGSPSNGNDKMIWEVDANNKYFKTDDKGALYNYDMTTLMILNGGSGDTYTVPYGTIIIREWALYENSVIKTLTLPATMEKLEQNCITGTPNLSTITCLGKTPAKYVGKNGTKNKAGSSGVKTIYVPKGCTEAYKEAWAELVKEDGWTITDDRTITENK